MKNHLMPLLDKILRELWIRLSQIWHDNWPHVDFGLRKGVGGKAGEDMDQSISGRSVASVLQPHM